MKIFGRVLIALIFITLGIGAIVISSEKIAAGQIVWAWLSGIFFGLSLLAGGIAIIAGVRLQEVFKEFL